jgi:hypothetical protein
MITTRNATPQSGMQCSLFTHELPFRLELMFHQLIIDGRGTTDPVGLRAALCRAVESGAVPPPRGVAVATQTQSQVKREATALAAMGRAA